jgi:hypothetical protein
VWQKILHDRIVNEGVLQNEKGAKGLTNTISKLRLLCNHPYLLQDEWVEDENFTRVSGKIFFIFLFLFFLFIFLFFFCKQFFQANLSYWIVYFQNFLQLVTEC